MKISGKAYFNHPIEGQKEPVDFNIESESKEKTPMQLVADNFGEMPGEIPNKLGILIKVEIEEIVMPIK